MTNFDGVQLWGGTSADRICIASGHHRGVNPRTPHPTIMDRSRPLDCPPTNQLDHTHWEDHTHDKLVKTTNKWLVRVDICA